MPNNPFYREGDNQLMPTLFVGHSQPGAGGRRQGRPLQGHATGEGHRRRVVGAGDRLQDGVAELIGLKSRASRFIPRRPNFLPLGLRISPVYRCDAGPPAMVTGHLVV